MIVNVWLALRDDAQSAINTRLDWDEETQGEYNGPVTDRQAKVFQLMADRANIQRLFKTDTIGGREWTLWNVYFNESSDILLKVKTELDQLTVNYPTQFVIAGAWLWDGTQVAGYPPHTRLIEFMPDIDDIGARPLTVSDVNLGLGQSPRQF